MFVAYGIVQQHFIQVGIQVFPVCEPPSWISDSCSLYIVWEIFNEFIHLENMRVAVGILQLCCKQAGI